MRSTSYQVKSNRVSQQKETNFYLILGIHLTYTFVILDIKRKNNNFFWNFLNISLVLVTLINWLLRQKMHAKTYFLEFFCMKIRCDFVFYLWETLLYAWKQNFYIFFFCNISEKTGYFNTGFAFLQCKNANQY